MRDAAFTLMLILSGCADTIHDPRPAGPWPPAQAPAPFRIGLDGPAFVLQGAPLTLTLTSLTPGQGFAVYGSRDLPPPLACPPGLGGACLALGEPAHLVASGTAAGNQHALRLRTPPAPATLRLQAVKALAVGGPVLSDVLTVEVLDRAGDHDGDGLTNEDEVRHGTSPLRADTDRDGLDDGQEVALRTDPTAADTDRDGLSDGDEVTFGTDPRARDTDGDGVNDAGERRDGTDPLSADTDGDGLDDGQERDLRTNPLRADTDADGLPDADEVRLGADPRDRDTDDDGLSDGTEVDHGFDPLRADPDHDGLGDREEHLAGTDPHDPNTDGDRLDDLQEVQRGSDPLDPLDPFAEPIVDTADGGCAPDEVLSCWGACVPDRRGDGDCQRWLACDRYLDDLGDCAAGAPPAACPPGTIADCLGDCSPLSLLADGACDPALACPMRGWDDGDCPAPPGNVVAGTWIVDSGAAAAALSGVSQIDGALLITTGAPDPLILPDLVAIGALRVEGGPRRVSLPSLRVLGDDADVTSPTLTDLSLPVLDMAVRGVHLDGATSLRDAALPALRTVGDGVRLRHLPALTSLSLDALETTGRLTLDGDINAAVVELPALQRVVEDLTLWSTDAAGVIAPTLTEIGGQVIVDRTSGSCSLSLPALASPVRLTGRQATLGDVDLSGASEVEELVVEGRVGLVSLDAATVAGTVRVRSAGLVAPALVVADEVSAEGVVVLSSLEDVDLLDVDGTVLDAPSLRHAGSVRVSDAAAAITLDLSSLEAVDRGLTLRLHRTGAVSLPALRAAVADPLRPPGPLFQPYACDALLGSHGPDAFVDAPQLVTAGCVRLDGAVSAPQLQTAWSLDVRVASSLPALTLVGHLDLRLGVLTAPALTRVGLLVAPTQASLHGVQGLTDVDALQAFDASTVALPNLARLGATYARPTFDAQWTLDGLWVGPTVTGVELPALTAATSLSLSEQLVDRDTMRETVAALPTPPPAVGLTLSLPSLVTLGALDLIHDRRFAAVDLPALASLGGKLRLHDAPGLVAVSAPSLATTGAEGWINLVNLPALQVVELPALTTVGRLALVNVGLDRFQLPGLVTALDHLTAYDNDALVAWQLPHVTSAVEVYLDNNPALADVDLDDLAQAQRLTATRLPQLDVCALLADLAAADLGEVVTDVGCP